MAYIKRDIEDKILALSKEYSCILITGPRQVGKTTVLRQLMDDDREYVTLDDLDERSLAKRDPAMFLQIHLLAHQLPSFPAHGAGTRISCWPCGHSAYVQLASGKFSDRDVFYSSYL